jgi:hypothetical protein
MNAIQPQTNQKTLDILTQLEASLEEALSRILIQSSRRPQAETQTRIEKEMEDTQHLLKRLKGLYCLSCPI